MCNYSVFLFGKTELVVWVDCLMELVVWFGWVGWAVWVDWWFVLVDWLVCLG